jgi:hypothetical protein
MTLNVLEIAFLGAASEILENKDMYATIQELSEQNGIDKDKEHLIGQYSFEMQVLLNSYEIDPEDMFLQLMQISAEPNFLARKIANTTCEFCRNMMECLDTSEEEGPEETKETLAQVYMAEHIMVDLKPTTNERQVMHLFKQAQEIQAHLHLQRKYSF